MKVLSAITLIILVTVGCHKTTINELEIPVPNGDFELWTSAERPGEWITNSCPPCMPPYETYIVKKITDAEHGQFAAEFIYNGVYPSFAENKFSVSARPSLLSAYIRSTISDGDTASIHIDLFSGNNKIDSGSFYETSSHSSYHAIEASISHNSLPADSAFISIKGGKKRNTVIDIDNITLIKQ